MLALLALSAAPAAAQQSGGPGERVDLALTRVPAELLTGVAAPVDVTLQNKEGAPARATLMAGLFDPGSSPRCNAPGDKWRGYVEVFRVTVDVPAGATVPYPREERASPADRFQVRVPPAMGAPPGDYEVCVWAVDADSSPQAPTLFDLAVFPVRLRVENSLPEVDFTFSPRTGITGTPLTFTAVAGEDPEGDPLTYRWDFGRFTVSGRATAEGPEVTHAFYPAGTYTVTLTVSDGFGSVQRTHEVRVTAAATGEKLSPARAEEESLVPGPGGVLAPLAVALAALATAARRARRPQR